MSGWCPCCSASSPTRLVNASAVTKSLNGNSFSKWCSLTTRHAPPRRCWSFCSSTPLSGGTPPLHGTHSSFARSLATLPPGQPRLVIYWAMPRPHFVLLLVASLGSACTAPAPARPPSPLPPPASARDQRPSLYHRLGGLEAIRAVIGDFVGRITSDERISAFFAGSDMDEIKARLVEFVCVASGGGCRYQGRSMREAHEGMDITDAHFDALVDDLVASLDALKVPEQEKNDLLALLAPLRAQIVSAR